MVLRIEFMAANDVLIFDIVKLTTRKTEFIMMINSVIIIVSNRGINNGEYNKW